MTPHPATSTPRPLPRERESVEKRPRLSHAGAVPAQLADNNVNSSGLPPAFQTDKAPRARRKPIQRNEGQSDSRLATLARLEALRTEIRQLAEDIAHGADIDLLDLLRDEVGSYSRHKAVQEARTWAEQGRLFIETGLMQLDRALHPST